MGVSLLERGQLAVALLQHRHRDAARPVPRQPVLHGLSAETRLVVSEPLGDLAGAWNEIPESSMGVVQEGEDELRPFRPRLA
jgi:hypothetical protein